MRLFHPAPHAIAGAAASQSQSRPRNVCAFLLSLRHLLSPAPPHTLPPRYSSKRCVQLSAKSSLFPFLSLSLPLGPPRCSVQCAYAVPPPGKMNRRRSGVSFPFLPLNFCLTSHFFSPAFLSAAPLMQRQPLPNEKDCVRHNAFPIRLLFYGSETNDGCCVNRLLMCPLRPSVRPSRVCVSPRRSRPLVSLGFGDRRRRRRVFPWAYRGENEGEEGSAIVSSFSPQ